MVILYTTWCAIVNKKYFYIAGFCFWMYNHEAMGESRKNPILAKDGTIPMTVRLPPDLHARLLARAKKDGMKLNALISRLMDFGLAETETVFKRREAAPSGAEKDDVTGSGTRRRVGGERS